ncbi:MAG: transglycosylase SLT domain-containing protein [Halieaceae bacterium]|nr:transglycosylase SLT domain-containing protein [Halieaceae bacterium]
MRFRVRIFLLFCLLPTALPAVPAAADTADDVLASERRQYDAALRAVNKGRWTEYEQLRPGLEDYPLAMYLDYYQLTRQSGAVRPADALRFIDRSAGSPLPNRYTNAYLREAGQDGRWRDFLAVKADEPAGIELKCYYFRARLAAGDTDVAWEGAARLWDAGESRPDACDPLFSAWIAAGQLTDDIVWARQLKAFDARQRSLMTYVAKRASPALAPWADKLLAVYQQPDKMRRQSLPPDSPYSADIASHGLALLARYSPGTALEYWTEYQQELEFTAQQTRQVEYAIALHGLFAEEEALAPWLQGALERLQDDKLVELRLRWLLAEQDWAALAQTLPLLSQERRGHESWRYWQGVVLEKQGDTAAANAIFEEVSRERSFHGFLASDKLGNAYSFNHQTPELDPGTAGDLRRLPVVRRVGELNFHESYSLAHSEWYYLLQAQDRQRNEQLAQLASQQGWYRMAIDAASRAESWDALDLRFPTPYQEAFRRNASLQKVPSTELMAIARRESAFYPWAQSPVGARGLMQLMPATGKEVASSLGKRQSSSDLFDVEHNVLLGSAYYRQLLDRFGGNRVFALTAYNAGPHRVDRWRHKPGEGVPVDVWIDTIPYKETREYVQAVLFYNVVFQYLMGDTRSLLTPAELQATY